MIYFGRFVFAMLFGAPGVFLLWATWKGIESRRRWLTVGVLTEGEVVALKEQPRARSKVAARTLLAPVVEYRVPPENEQVRRFTSAQAEGPSPFVVGQKVPVRYLVDEGQAELNAVAGGWFAIAATATLSLGCLGAALVPIIITVRELSR